ncbi:MAG: hypothetical protein QOJ17_407, partial [Rhodospirillaceae bacterium]|nr:hypothetical protein [Rhodospirillaceae bacterium]
MVGQSRRPPARAAVDAGALDSLDRGPPGPLKTLMRA